MKDDFIGIYENVFSKEWCDRVIKYFEAYSQSQRTWNRLEGQNTQAHDIDDESMHMQPHLDCYTEYDICNTAGKDFKNEFDHIFGELCYAQYTKKYSVLNFAAEHTIYHQKVQKTIPGGGYHNWHCESNSPLNSRRLAAYTIYLNDIEEGGETEFLYLSKRIKPTTGTVVIFPTNYPWTHRGNPPLSETKYIMTGWLEYK